MPGTTAAADHGEERVGCPVNRLGVTSENTIKRHEGDTGDMRRSRKERVRRPEGQNWDWRKRPLLTPRREQGWVCSTANRQLELTVV